jgi:hypothetical protein
MENYELFKAIEKLGCHVREFKEDVHEFEGERVLTGDILLRISPETVKSGGAARLNGVTAEKLETGLRRALEGARAVDCAEGAGA